MSQNKTEEKTTRMGLINLYDELQKVYRQHDEGILTDSNVREKRALLAESRKMAMSIIEYSKLIGILPGGPQTKKEIENLPDKLENSQERSDPLGFL